MYNRQDSQPIPFSGLSIVKDMQAPSYPPRPPPVSLKSDQIFVLMF